ncbi:MAG: class I SAM-dependent methyltransferase family protein [Candidatus Hydrothermarchaeales archaeon]
MSHIAVRVERFKAREVIGSLRKDGYFDEGRMIQRRDGYVEIPVLSAPFERDLKVVRQKNPHFMRPRLSYAWIIKSFGLKGEVAMALKHWELLGDVLVINLPESTKNKEEIARGLMGLIPRAKAVLNYKGVSGVYREPKAELLVGDSTETIHRENGCTFKLDPMKVMFSSGNQGEKMRMAKVSNQDEIVLDMFAGIGQFTIPVAKYSMPQKVYAIEKNPIAYSYLSENVKLNELSNVETIQGDCRDVSPRGAVDRVIMGYFNSADFIPTALEAFRGSGVIHHHLLVKKSKLSEEAEKLVGEINNRGYSATIKELKTVKSYAPSLHHCVVDISIARTKNIRARP